jgi:hypothetical protein
MPLRPLRLALLAAILMAGSALSAWARPLTAEEAESLNKAVTRYLSSIQSRNAESIVNAIPPRVLNIFAGTAGIEAKDLNAVLEKQTAELMKDSSFTDLTSDQTALDATDATMDDGTKVTWVAVPTAFTATVKGKKTRNEQALLALDEGGKWYFLRIDGAQQKMIAALAYPFLANATMPEPKVTPIN